MMFLTEHTAYPPMPACPSSAREFTERNQEEQSVGFIRLWRIKPISFSVSSVISSGPCERVRKNPGFTLLELLVVISIIAILAGMVIPTFYYAKKRAREAKARVTVKALETAFKAYLETYKVWPNSVDEATTYDVADSTVNLFSMLRGSDVALNPQGIAFFEFENMTNYPIAYQNTALDPWSNPSDSSSFKAYHVMFDKDYDNKITVPASAGGDVAYRCVVVWSDGPRDETNIVASWK